MPVESNETLRDLLESRVSKHADKPFLFSAADGREWTYSEFDKAVNRTANMLIANGGGKGDVVSLLLPNSPEYIIAYFACWKIGALAGPVNSLLKREEIEWAVGNSEAKLVLANSSFRDVLCNFVVSEESSTTNSHKETRKKPHVVFYDDAAAATANLSEAFKPVELSADAEAIIIYTSGTTGKPKGCLLTHGNLIANARQITEWLRFGQDDRLLTMMPLFHMNAVCVTTVTALYAGGSTVVAPKFSASRFWDWIEKYKVTSFGSVATMLSMLLQKNSEIRNQKSEANPNSKIQNPKSESLRFAMCGSAPVPAEVLRKFEETFGVLVIEGYGMSESTVRSTFNPPNENRRPGSCGVPIGNEMKVFDESDQEVADGELGEIVLRGPNIFKGYFKNPEATEKAFANGWFHTGDIGYRDPDGFFYIADRKSDMIIRGGENIYPREIDDLLYTHPAVAAAAVIGVPDELYGEEVAAFIVLKNGFKSSPSYEGGVAEGRGGSLLSAEDIIKFCKQHLADYKCPKTVHFVEDIPKGPTGKLLKRELSKLVGTQASRLRR